MLHFEIDRGYTTDPPGINARATKRRPINGAAAPQSRIHPALLGRPAIYGRRVRCRLDRLIHFLILIRGQAGVVNGTTMSFVVIDDRS